jgi:UDP-N-acetylglucosamine acyltransferase
MSAVSALIHPTAIIDPAAELAPGIRIGPYAIIEGRVHLGAGCVVRARAHLIGPLSAGIGNDFGINAVVGERAQHLVYQDDPGEVEIGDYNVIRENVTIHRGTPDAGTTRVGSHNFLMACTHIAHDCRVGDHCVLANGAVIGGHVVLADRVFLSGNTGVHQMCRVGRCAMLSATSSATNDIPPFLIQVGRNEVAGVNVVGLRRAGLTAVQISAIRQAYRILLHSGELIKPALRRIERELGHIDVVAELITFIRESKRGVCLTRTRRELGTKPGDTGPAAIR